jgi:hypothetical protein
VEGWPDHLLRRGTEIVNEAGGGKPPAFLNGDYGQFITQSKK